MRGERVPDDACLFTLEEWNQAIDDRMVATDDGSGRWVKDGRFLTGELDDDVFGHPPPAQRMWRGPTNDSSCSDRTARFAALRLGGGRRFAVARASRLISLEQSRQCG
jgi:hypothetical protein